MQQPVIELADVDLDDKYTRPRVQGNRFRIFRFP